ncbi:MAG: CBS domain-containing protein [Myxococcota bacterium]
MSDQLALTCVDDIMDRRATTLSPSQSLREAFAHLEAEEKAGAPVVHDGRVVGFLSQLDCIRAMSTSAFHRRPTGVVQDHMTAPTITTVPDADLFNVAEEFLESGHHHLPVVDEAGGLLGVVALSDVCRGLVELRRRAPRLDHPAGAAWDPLRSRARDRSRR